MTYFPPSHPAWEHAKSPAPAFAAAAQFAAEHETPWQRDLAYMIANDFGEVPPWNEALGPVRPRGGPNGLLIRGGQIVAEWGDTNQVDLTFSVAKSYLSILAGLAFDRGLIRDMHEPVGKSVHDGGFEGPHNSKITWHHLLQQTSEWEGELFGKPDLIDRNRQAGGASMSRGAKKGTHRDLQEPGTFWEYNDVRVNRLSLSLLRIWKRPLPDVFRELVMQPIGASASWEWHGYRNSYVDVDGVQMQSVSGGSHWGGGVFIHARDQARIGLLMVNDGVWNGTRILSSEWIKSMRQPCDIFPGYGYFWWLNTGRKYYPPASASSYFALGAGGNLTWIDPENDLVGVMRWMDPGARNGFIERTMAAI